MTVGKSPISSLALSPDASRMLISHVNSLRIIRLESNQEEQVIKTQNTTDAVWLTNPITSTSSGQLLLWNSANTSKRLIQAHERAINRISQAPSDPLLLSCSQDGSIKLWDLRTSQAKCTISHSESVRDVQFHPSLGQFVAGFDNGSVRVFDLRQLSFPLKTLAAHAGVCLAVDYNQSGLLATAGRDKTIKIWNTRLSSRLPQQLIQTCFPVSRVKWRPGLDQLAVSGLRDSNTQIWDLNRPSIPRYNLAGHYADVTGITWGNDNLLYSCSKDGTFLTHPSRNWTLHQDLFCGTTMGWSPDGDLSLSIFLPQLLPRLDIKAWNSQPPKDWNQLTVQFSGIVETETFDHAGFVKLANGYKLEGDLYASCTHNAELAERCGLHLTSQTWKLASKAASKLPERVLKFGSQVSQVPENHVAIYAESSSDSDLDILGPSHREEFKPKKQLVTPVARSPPTFMIPEWDSAQSISNMLDDLVNRGELQLCVSIALVLHQAIQIDEPKLQRYIMSYFDQLHLLQLYIAATNLINRSKITSLQTDTTILSKCSKCNSFSPDKCRCRPSCIVCHQHGGMYTFCRDCGHGGHVRCLRGWFKTNVGCPSGCGHCCI